MVQQKPLSKDLVLNRVRHPFGNYISLIGDHWPKFGLWFLVCEIIKKESFGFLHSFINKKHVPSPGNVPGSAPGFENSKMGWDSIPYPQELQVQFWKDVWATE